MIFGKREIHVRTFREARKAIVTVRAGDNFLESVASRFFFSLSFIFLFIFVYIFGPLFAAMFFCGSLFVFLEDGHVTSMIEDVVR